MAAILPTTLGDIGRIGILEVFRVECEFYEDISGDVLGNKFNTRQTFEIFKSLVGLGVPRQYSAGQTILADSLAPLYTQNFTPVKVATAVEFAYETAFVDRYNQIASLQSQAAQQFILKRNLVASNIDNTGFTATTFGMNNETLYSTAHGNNNFAGSNRPAIDVPLGPLAIMQMRKEMTLQQSARGAIMPYNGPVVIKYPSALAGTAYALAESDRQPGSNINDKNYARRKFDYVEIPFYTSDTAWFARYEDNRRHGLFMLNQIPYDCIELPINQAMLYVYIMFETYLAGWKSWQGTWGTSGA